MEANGAEMIPGSPGDELPQVLLWPSRELDCLRELFSVDSFLSSHLATWGEFPPPPHYIVVADESSVTDVLTNPYIRQTQPPIVLVLDRITVPRIKEVFFDHKYLNIKGFFRRERLARDLRELGRLAQVLREELELLAGERDEDCLELTEWISLEGAEDLAQITSLFVDAKMRRFLQDLGQVLEQTSSSPLKDIGTKFWEDPERDLQGLFRTLGAYLRGESPTPGNQQRGSNRVNRGTESWSLKVWEFLSKANPATRRTMEAITTSTAQLTGLSRQRLHVLLGGETGTGKTLVARWIAAHLGLAERFAHINVSAIPPELLESELFGAVSGAYTGAVDRPGILLETYGGVVFLDEIGDMPLELQSKLLVYLDDYSFTPLGWPSGIGKVTAPCYVVAATNQPLEEKIKRGEFREDLYYRFLYKLHLPPLRERKADLPLLVDLVLQDTRVNQGGYIRRISYQALSALQSYPFSGNFRELEDVLSRCCSLATRQANDTLQEKHVFRAMMELAGRLE